MMRFFATFAPNRLLIGWLTLGWLLPGVASAATEPRRPNIFYIIVDDQSPFDFRFYNPASTLHAPATERLAAEGMVLDAAYHMGSFSGAVCTPSRCWPISTSGSARRTPIPS